MPFCAAGPNQATQQFWTEAAKEFLVYKVSPGDFKKPAERYKQWRSALQSKLGPHVDLTALYGFRDQKQFEARHWVEPKFESKSQRANFKNRRSGRLDSAITKACMPLWRRHPNAAILMPPS